MLFWKSRKYYYEKDASLAYLRRMRPESILSWFGLEGYYTPLEHRSFGSIQCLTGPWNSFDVISIPIQRRESCLLILL